MWMTILRRRFILKIENGAWDLSLMTRLLLDGSKFCVMLASLGVTFGLIPVLLNAFTRRLESIGVFSNLIFTNNQLIMPIGEVFVSKKCSTRCPLSFRWKAVLAPNPPGSVRSVRFAPCVSQPFHNVLRSREHKIDVIHQRREHAANEIPLHIVTRSNPNKRRIDHHRSRKLDRLLIRFVLLQQAAEPKEAALPIHCEQCDPASQLQEG